ncbi:MAG TPA: dihydropteroate synthase [Gemmatimonadales bacterium]|nr:dihydropteroate synthase [Gemmatimonadales bacterium]
MRAILRSHGWEEGRAAAAAGGMHPLAIHLTGLDQGALEALVRFAGGLGLEVLTGEAWAVLAGSRSRLSAFARPWTVPEPLAEAAVAVGLALPPDIPLAWRTARGPIALDRPVLMGILNLTPDSFSDGGRFLARDAALAQADYLVESGAAIVDVGGESTRPDRAEPVELEEELRRVVPVVEALARARPGLLLSVDTVKAAVARAALEAGAAIVNDVTAFRLEPAMAEVVAASGCGVVLMHSRGGVLEIASYTYADYGGDVVGGVLAELREAVATATASGIDPEAIAIDPGFGFSKTVEQNIAVLDQLAAFQSLGRPVLAGPSRKRFLGAVTGLPVEDRDRATAAACALAWGRGARLFRVHDVAAAREALALAAAVEPVSA